MPVTKSAKKRLRQSEERRLHNRSVKRTLRSQLRKVREAIASGDAEASQGELRAAAKQLDQAAARNILHRNTVARTKSRLSARVKALKQKAAGA
jgi:small subunit ribosomal protein S20